MTNQHPIVAEALERLRQSTACDWLLTAPPQKTAYGYRVHTRNANVRIGGYLATHSYETRSVDDPRYFRTCEPIAYALCVLANNDTRHYYAAELVCADTDEDKAFWSARWNTWERGE